MSRPTRESIMTALFNALVAGVQISFTATTKIGDPVLYGPSTTAGLFVGLPVEGAGVPRGTVIQSLSPLTLTNAATASSTSPVSLSTGFLTASRRLQMWGTTTEQPALFLRDGSEHLEYPNTMMQEQRITAEIWIYNNAGQNPDLAPITGLNNLLDAIQSVFAADDSMMGRFTLGGLVSWCRLNGKVEKWPGDLDGQAIAVMDVEIIVP